MHTHRMLLSLQEENHLEDILSEKKVSHKGTNSAGLYLHEVLGVIKTIRRVECSLLGQGGLGLGRQLHSISCVQFWFGKTKTWMLGGDDGVGHAMDVI